MSTNARNAQQLIWCYLWLALRLREVKAKQPPVFVPGDASPVFTGLVVVKGDYRGLTPKGLLFVRSWQRKGLHIRWGMCRQAPELYSYRSCAIASEWRGYTTHADFQQQQTNLDNFSRAVAQFEDGG